MTEAGTIVLTGATGFVGGHLLARILADDDRHVVCLVRAGSERDAVRRGDEVFQTVFGRAPTPGERARVTWRSADLEEPQLGLTGARWAQLAAHTEEIFHCAASTRFDLPLEEAQRINVDGMHRVHELAVAASRRRSFERFHHVSTAYVAGRRKGSVDPHFLPSDRARNFRNTYERTKARAERFLRDQDDVPVTIYRPSIIAGERTNGRTTNWNVLYAPMRMISRGSLPMLCSGGRALVDTVAVDFVVDAIFALARQSTKQLEAHHLTAGESVICVRDFVDGCHAGVQRHRPETTARTVVVGRVRWHGASALVRASRFAPRRFKRLRTRGRIGTKLLAGFAPYVPYTQVSTHFDVSRDHPLLAEAGIEMPAGREYLDTVVAYALSTDFGRRAAKSSDLEAVA